MSWLAEAMIASTLLMAVVLMLRRPAARFFGARAAYLLWLLPPLRLILPPLPEGSAAAAVLPQGLGRGSHYLAVQVDSAAATATAAFPWIEMAVTLWLTGLLLFLAVQFLGYARFRALMLEDAVPVAREGAIRVVESACASGPMAFGILRKYVALPVDFADRYAPDEQAMALAHEYTHHRRGDLAANMVALLVLGLHWFNPIAWVAYRAFRNDQELACDAQVLARHGGERAQAYGRAILKAATGRHFAAACHLNTVNDLKGRLRMLSDRGKSLHRISWGMTAVAAVTIAGLAFTASGSRAAEEVAAVSDRMRDVRLVRMASFLPPAPAEPAPEAPEAIEAPEPPEAPEPLEAPEPFAAPAYLDKHLVILSHDGKAHPATHPVPPMPPVPPLPPEARIDAHQRALIRRQALEGVPTAAEIRRMVPDVAVEHRCQGREPVSSTETTTVDGRQRVRVMICNKAIERDARRSALKGLQEARRDISREANLSPEIRTRILADLDRDIARMRSRAD